MWETSRQWPSGTLTLFTPVTDLKHTSYLSVSVFAAYIDTSDWEFPDVCKYYFGKFGQWSSLVFSMVSLIGAMVVYWVLMSNFLFNTGKFIYSKILYNYKLYKLIYSKS